MNSVFPRGVALGDAFYDRRQERAKLKNNILNNIHTALIAPRRIGKTSLMNQVLYAEKIKHVWFDFMTITSRESAQAKLIEKVCKLILKIAPTEQKLKNLTKTALKTLNPKITVGIATLSIELTPHPVAHEGIIEILMSLDKLAGLAKERIVVVCDEFQEIVNIDADASLQASIRHAAERSQNITYLFSGSRHRPLRRLFSGKENPLYELCALMTLDKISEKDYIDYIQKHAIKKWGTELSNEILQRIFYYTECYPKYINALCGSLWASGLAPTIEVIEQLWEDYFLSKKTDVSDEIADLTLNQKRLLEQLCANETSAPYGREFLSKLNMSQSSVKTAMEVLLDKDLVIFNDGVYRVLEPIIKYYFEKY